VSAGEDVDQHALVGAAEQGEEHTADQEEATVPEYMLLLYAPHADDDERDRRWAEMPLWDEVTENLREAGVWVANAPLYPVESATTVRVRGDETELTDGPFAVTKEVLAGYYVLDCADLDEAIGHAARLPLARYGSVEVRPIVMDRQIPRPDAGRGSR
jgi:hypothetical protein